MHASIRDAITEAVQSEPLAITSGMKLTELEDEFSAVEMLCRAEMMDSLFGRTHGGAIYSLFPDRQLSGDGQPNQQTAALFVALKGVGFDYSLPCDIDFN